MKVGAYSVIISGYAFNSKLFNAEGHGNPLIRIRDVGKNKTETFFNGEYPQHAIVNNGDFLIGMDGDFRLCEWQGGKALLNQRVCKIVPDERRVNTRYIMRLLPAELKRIEDKTSFATVKHLSVKKIKEIDIPLPPLEEQKQIAAILDAADELRQKDKALIAKYDELTQSLFLDMFGDPVSNQKVWEVARLKDIALKIRSGNTPKGGSKVYVSKGVTFFRSQNVWKNLIKLEDVVFIDETTHCNMKNSSLKHGDILMTKTGRFNTENSSLGRAAMYLGKDDDANVNGHVYLIRLKDDVQNKFVLFILTTNQYRNYIRRVCVGGIDKRQINKEHLEEFPIIQPPLELQEKFSLVLTKIQAQKAIAHESLIQSEALFSSLLQKAFKGKLTN
ncbi:MAG: restriction endonuclease subunit S [FCB group bacterium]|nr:restriction endonuclease subunit S [FCB group bacterium]